MRKKTDFSAFLNIPPSVPASEILSRILAHSRSLTGAEGGSIFMVREEGQQRWLEATHFQNDRIPVPNAGLRIPLSETSIAGYAASTGEMLRIADAYRIPASMPYRFNAAPDRANGYVTRSILAFPMKNGDGRVVGVVQLINRHDAAGKGPLPFPASDAKLLAPLNHFVGTTVERAEALERITAQNVELERRGQRIQELQRETEAAFRVSVKLLARAAEVHDEDTGNHILRVNEYSYFLARLLGQPAEWCDELRYSAALHDVGKMSVDAAVLKKRGPLDQAEREEMNRHSEYGWLILKDNARLQMAAEIALNHHEKWDGTGYPHKLAGEAIPLSARIVQMADIYDALRSARPYKPAFSHEKTVGILTVGDSRIVPERDFDPRLREAFAANHEDFDRIWRELHD
jgi:hypothetical protein